MFKKKSDFAWVGMVVLVIGALAVVSYLQRDKGITTEEWLKGTTGHTLYKIHENLTAISNGDPLSEEQLARTHDHLLTLGAYAETIDFSLSAAQPLLKPIAANMAQIARHLEDQRLANPSGWVSDNEVHYAKLLETAKNAIPLINQVYYVPNSQEGAEASLTLRDKEVLVDFNQTLDEYVASLP